MKIGCFIFDWENDKVQNALTKIVESFHCYMWCDSETNEFYIEAREEDWPAIERIIAPFV